MKRSELWKGACVECLSKEEVIREIDLFVGVAVTLYAKKPEGHVIYGYEEHLAGGIRIMCKEKANAKFESMRWQFVGVVNKALSTLILDKLMPTKEDKLKYGSLVEQALADKPPTSWITIAEAIDIIEEKTPVRLMTAGEIGEQDKWAVIAFSLSNPYYDGFWLDVFDTEDGARSFCARHDLPIIEGV